MPKVQRTEKEIQAVREDILKNAMELLNQDGFNGFSMRKLAARLNIAAKTIYNYFYNQDELYLHILIWGFDRLHQDLVLSVQKTKDPIDRLEAAIHAFVNFGLENPELYNLMFTLHVPKFNDYLDTPMEPVAQKELETALKNAEFFTGLIADCLVQKAGMNKEDIPEGELRFEMIQAWTRMHGYVAGINNTLLDYMHEKPLDIKERLLQRIMDDMRRELLARGNKPNLHLVDSRN